MKSVSKKKYDYEYYKNLYGIFDYSKRFTSEDFKEIQRYISSLVKHTNKEFVVDFGCGNGDLAILLAHRYSCKTLGIDYSPDAIKIAKASKKILEKHHPRLVAKVDFTCAKNENLPGLKDVSAVYLCDVIEHLYDEEVDYVIRKFISWNSSNLKLIIHTDNNNYLRYARPFIDLIALLLGKTTLKDINSRNLWENERHVNLTTPKKLAKKLSRYGFKVIKMHYSPITRDRIENQLGHLGSLNILVSVVNLLAPLLVFFLPSFYIVLERKSS